MTKDRYVRRGTALVLLGLVVAMLPGTGLTPASAERPTAAEGAPYLTPEQYDLLDTMFRVHMNYFVSPEVISAGGLPMTAYKVGWRDRFAYSNPTEWGYFLQAWIAGAERGIISRAEAQNRIGTALGSMQALQDDPEQSYMGLFYPYYKMTDGAGSDLPLPRRDPDNKIPSGDNALLYASLLITEGWAKQVGNSLLEDLARSIKDRMTFDMFVYEDQDKLFIAHQIDALTGVLSDSRWQFYADEGGVVTWLAYYSGSVTFEDYEVLTDSQDRRSASWRDCQGKLHVVNEAAHFNAMFTWGIRSLVGFPIGSFDCIPEPTSRYAEGSFVPTVEAHLAYGECLGIDYPGFSDAMTQAAGGQGLVGRFTPPNLENVVPTAPPEHIVPHAFFVPFNAGPDLGQATIGRLTEIITELRDDWAGYYHDSGAYPFGFEVIAGPHKNDVDYSGADDGRNIFETLSHSYIVLSLFNGLQFHDGGSTFCTYVTQVTGYEAEVKRAVAFLYPEPKPWAYLPLVMLRVQAPCPAMEYLFGSGGSEYPEERTIAIDASCMRVGENTLVLGHAGSGPDNQWMVWDSLYLRTVGGDVIWALGQNEAPPDYTPVAFDEFDQEPPYVTDFTPGQMKVDQFPKELNDLSFPRITIHFTLNQQQADSSMRLFLDALYATHDSTPYFAMRVRMNPWQ